MEKRIKRSVIALLFACTWGVFALCSPVAVRPAEQAHAATMDDVITVWAEAKYTSSDTEFHSTPVDFVWGYIYRGIGILDEADWEFGSVSGNVVIETYEDGYHIGNIDGSDWEHSLAYLVTMTDTPHEHDFTIGGSWESIDEKSHWAVCDECDCRFQVAHRLNSKGVCEDCGEDLSANYTSTYQFTGIPDYITNTPEDVSGDFAEFNESGVAEFMIEFNADLFLGRSLTLNLESESGMLEDGDKTISYTVEVSSEFDVAGGDLVTESYSGSGKTAIWKYSAPTEYDEESPDFMTHIDGTITITLTLNEIAYAGNFSETLTFSATLKEV